MNYDEIRMFLFNLEIFATELACAILFLVSVVAFFHIRDRPSFLRTVGALGLVVAGVLALLTHVPPRGGRIEPKWIPEAEIAFDATGILLFAIGYAWDWIGRLRSRKPHKPAEA